MLFFPLLWFCSSRFGAGAGMGLIRSRLILVTLNAKSEKATSALNGLPFSTSFPPRRSADGAPLRAGGSGGRSGVYCGSRCPWDGEETSR